MLAIERLSSSVTTGSWLASTSVAVSVSVRTISSPADSSRGSLDQLSASVTFAAGSHQPLSASAGATASSTGASVRSNGPRCVRERTISPRHAASPTGSVPERVGNSSQRHAISRIGPSSVATLVRRLS